MSFRTVVIPVAGLGTRFLPVTKAVAKELVPLVDRPLVQYAVEEAVAAGAERAVFVASPGKEGILDLFRPDAELERTLAGRGKDDLLAVVRDLTSLVRVESVIQAEPLGVGHAILQAREAVGDEPFGVLFPDDFIQAEVPVLEQLRRVYEERGGIVVAVERVPLDQVHRYGVIRGDEIADGVYRVDDLVEKPEAAAAPSDMAIVGRYVFPGEIFALLERTRPGVGGEVQITDAMREALGSLPCHAVLFDGRRYDCGSRVGYLRATLAVAARDPELAEVLRAFLREL